MVISIANCPLMESGYMCIHDHNLSESLAGAKGHYYWRFVRDRLFHSVITCLEWMPVELENKGTLPHRQNLILNLGR